MEEERSDNEDCNCSCDCCNKRPISFIIIFIIVIDSISIIMNILVIAITHWKFVEKVLLSFTIISLVFVCIILGFDITILVFKRHLYKDNIKYTLSKIFSLCMLIINPLMFILYIILAIFISIQLHIADYPEYGGRERDEEYIKSHPDKFGTVSSGEFVIAALCPSLSSISQFICMFFSIALFRRVYYLPENYGNENNQINVRVETNPNDKKDTDIITYKKDLKISKTDNRLYPNQKEPPKDLSERVFEEINNEGK
jgi:hypothetical protein